MGKRSRLRAYGAKRRRLIILGLLVASACGGLVWYGSATGPELWEALRPLFGLTRPGADDRRQAVRGTIYDRNYKELAVSYERVSVYANIREIADVGRVVEPLATLFNTTTSDLYDRLAEGSLRIWLAKDISQEQEERLRSLDLQGIHLHREYVRFYPQHEAAAHLVGFVEKDTGLAGVEYYLNQLETKHRLEQQERDGLTRAGAGRPGVDGRHLVLTLDLKIERILEAYLDGLSARLPGVRVGALVMEAGSGALIGYAQRPSFDPNRFHTYPESVFNDVFTETMAVPDDFKVFLRDLSLLQSREQPAAGNIPWSVAAEKRKLGIQLQLWEKLGAASRPQYDFFATSSSGPSRVAHRGSSSETRDFETVPVLQTPLQLVTAMTRSLNGGTDITPHVGNRYVLRRNQEEFLLEDLEQEVHGGLLQDGVAGEAARLFAAQASTGPLGSAALAGTSASYVLEGAYTSFRRHYLLVSCIPVFNPELVVLVAASAPGYDVRRSDGFSFTRETMEIIGPIMALQRVMKNLADMMTPQERGDENFRAEAAEDSKAASMPAAEQQDGYRMRMPPMIGMSLRKSLRYLQNADVEVDVRGSGRVVGQEPPPGAELTPGMKVILVLRRDPVDFETEENSETTGQ